MRKELYLLLLVLLFALTLRLYPTLISGMPFSTDAWPLIRNTELLIQQTPTPLNNLIFDAYNNFWPGIQLFGATLAQTTGLTAITAMSLGIPIVSALTIIIFYLLVKKLTTNTKIAITAALLLAAAFSYTLYSSGVTKEAFASPIYMTLILLFTLKHDKKTTLLFSMTSLTLALTHHLTSFFATIIIMALTIGFYATKPDNTTKTNTNKSNLIFTLIQITITSAYFAFFASSKFTSAFSQTTILTVAAYIILAITLTFEFVHITNKNSTKKSIFIFIVGSIAAIYLMLTILNTCTLPGAQMLYALPLIIALPTALYGLSKLNQKTPSLTLPLFWLLATTGFICFTVFSNIPGGSDFTWRSMNFILPPLIILIATGAYKLYTTPKQHIKIHKLTKPLSALIILLIVALNSYGMYQTVTAQDSSLGYFWLYHPSEYNAANWIASNGSNQTTAGDAKPEYLLHQYFNKTVSNAAGLSYLAGNGAPPEILYIYNQMTEEGKGYVLGGVPITLPENWTNKLSNYNLVYANSEVTIYARR